MYTDNLIHLSRIFLTPVCVCVFNVCVCMCVCERVSDSGRLSRQEWEECIGLLNQGFISRLGLFRILWLPFFIFLLIGMLLEAAGES